MILHSIRPAGGLPVRDGGRAWRQKAEPVANPSASHPWPIPTFSSSWLVGLPSQSALGSVQRGVIGVRVMTLPVDEPGSEAADGSRSGGAVAGPLTGLVIEVELERVAGWGDVAEGTGANTGGEPRAPVAAVAAGWRLSLAWRFSRAVCR